jgi:hypothetical protein
MTTPTPDDLPGLKGDSDYDDEDFISSECPECGYDGSTPDGPLGCWTCGTDQGPNAVDPQATEHPLFDPMSLTYIETTQRHMCLVCIRSPNGDMRTGKKHASLRRIADVEAHKQTQKHQGRITKADYDAAWVAKGETVKGSMMKRMDDVITVYYACKACSFADDLVAHDGPCCKMEASTAAAHFNSHIHSTNSHAYEATRAAEAAAKLAARG